jgi:transcription elongation factor GreA
VIEEHTHDPDTVRLGSKITVMDMDSKEKEVYQVVGSQEAAPMNGRISEESPFGKALLGKARERKFGGRPPPARSFQSW